MAIVTNRSDVVLGELLTPDPDGVRVDFYTSQDYNPNTVSVWKNGIRKIMEWLDGYELPGGNVIRFKEAPLAGDSLQARYDPA